MISSLSASPAVTWQTALLAVTAGLLIAAITTPVGVSGAVFLLPVQLSVLHVPSPAVTPTNLLFNVVAGPGALLRYRTRGGLTGPLTQLLLIGTLPGVVVGAVIRVFAVPGPRVFRLIVAAVLLPLGLWLCLRALRPPTDDTRKPLPDRLVVALGVAAGTIGGIYGIGGGALLGPTLAARGIPIAQVAPAVLASTFVTSIAGALSYVVIAAVTTGDIAPHWPLGLLCGLGGLAGGYLGARLQPTSPNAPCASCSAHSPPHSPASTPSKPSPDQPAIDNVDDDRSLAGRVTHVPRQICHARPETRHRLGNHVSGVCQQSVNSRQCHAGNFVSCMRNSHVSYSRFMRYTVTSLDA